MINQTQNESLAKLADKLNPKLKTVESVLAITTLIGLELKSSEITQGGILLVLTLSALALVYFLSAYKSFETDTPIMPRFLFRLISWASSIGVIGILFRLQNYAGYNTMLIVGCVSLFMGLCIKFYTKIDFSKRIIIRALIILAIGLCLYLTPSEKLKELKIINSVERVNTP